MMAFIENCRRGRGGEHTGIVIHSLISPVSACRLFSHCVSVICCIIILFFFLFHPYKNGTCQCVCVCVFVSSHWEQYKTSAFFENANRFYLWPSPVREWVSILREVFVCSCGSVCVALCICLTQSIFALAVCVCVLGNSVFKFFCVCAMCQY